MGPILNTIIGASLKLGVNLINAWIEQRRQDQMMLAARDDKIVRAMLQNQLEQSNDPFVKSTRRLLFLSITFTMCFLMIYYALNPNITYDVIMPKGEHARWGLLSWIFGGKDWELVQMTGGLLLTSFFDLCFMVIGFYAVPSKRR
jgi:hypothetical protein